jgi:hypothetical protein
MDVFHLFLYAPRCPSGMRRMPQGLERPLATLCRWIPYLGPASTPPQDEVQHGFRACCPVAGEGSGLDNRYRVALSFSEKLVLIGDNDANQEVRRRMQDKAKERADFLTAELHFPPQEYKDIDNWVLAEPETALPIIKGWLED